MTPDRRQLIDSIYLEAQARDPIERDAYLTHATRGDAVVEAEVRSRLMYLVTNPEAGDTERGLRLGPYELLREIGRGGMGIVYLAVRRPTEYTQKVAVKLVRQGLDSELIVSRFRARNRSWEWRNPTEIMLRPRRISDSHSRKFVKSGSSPNFAEAVRWFLKSLELTEKLGASAERSLASRHEGLAAALGVLGQTREAIEHLRKSRLQDAAAHRELAIPFVTHLELIVGTDYGIALIDSSRFQIVCMATLPLLAVFRKAPWAGVPLDLLILVP